VAAPRQSTLLLVAVQFLTRLPLPALPQFEPGWLAQSMRYFPVVGAGIGLLNVAVWWLASRAFPMAVAVGLMLAVSMILTGAFHEDGLADACDGFGGARTAERTLAIMQDPRVGAFGALGLIVGVGLKWTTLAALPQAWLPFAVVTAHTFSRWCALGLIWVLPYARAGGEGKSHPFAAGLSARGWILSGLIALPVPLAVARWSLRDSEIATGLILAAGALVGALIVSVGLGAYFRRRIGGYTGDCLGAAQQVTELAILLVMLGAVLPHAPSG
jgi:adenosylcobinamide-GDP ribazoletransferase